MMNGKKIAIDARMIEMSGIGTYIQHLMGQGIYDYAFGNEEEIRKYDKNVKIIPFKASIYGFREQMCFPKRIMRRAGIELVHFPHYNVPLSYKGRFVVTVHDLTHVILPDFLGSKIKYHYAKFLLNHALKNAEHIFTVSENSKKDICEIFGIDSTNITVTYNAVGSEFREKPREEIVYLYDKYGIPRDRKVLLYVGNLKPHKNLGRLLEAFSMLDDKEEYCLVLVGKEFACIKLQEQERLLKIEGQVVHTGLVNKEDLIDLYNLADLFAFPSLYEGFGIPPLEAMACGTPVIAADNSSIPEVVGDAAVMFDAMDANDIKRAICEMSANNIEHFVSIGKHRAAGFSWDEMAGIVRDRLNQI